MKSKIEASFSKLKNYCESEKFLGWDPFDGLNSKVFKNIPFVRDNELCRLIWIQTFKKNPVNLRSLFLIDKDYNPKGLALFLSGYCNLYKDNPLKEYLEKITFLADKIISLRTEGYSGSCWGYNFDWQSRAFFQPKYTPTIVASTFIGYALLDAYDIVKNEYYKKHALSVCDFILKDLNREYDKDGNFAFSYSPIDRTCVFNASFLGARMLARAYSYSMNPEFLIEARKTVLYCCRNQKSDGSWTYSPLPFHQWIDNFHTGYNLECLAEYAKYSGDNSFTQNLNAGFDYYLRTFFLSSGIPKYYSNSVYPVDVHATAQFIITLKRLSKLEENRDLADKVINWTIDTLQSKKGYFYYQKNRLYIIKIPYIRWSEAWMFYGLSVYLQNNEI